jgi:hypothetical protein
MRCKKKGRMPRSWQGWDKFQAALQKLLGGIEFAVFASVVERDVGVGALLAEIDFARIERLGINVDADGTLVEFEEIENLMDGLEGIDIGGMGGVHFVNVGGDDATLAVGGIALVDAEVLDLQTANGSGHPTVLVAMVVNAAGLADFPADGHALEDIVLENEIAGVVSFGEEEVFVESFRTNGMAKKVALNVFEGEIAFGDGGETFHPIGDRELLGGHLLVHCAPHVPVRPRSGRLGNPEIRAIAEGLYR